MSYIVLVVRESPTLDPPEVFGAFFDKADAQRWIANSAGKPAFKNAMFEIKKMRSREDG